VAETAGGRDAFGKEHRCTENWGFKSALREANDAIVDGVDCSQLVITYPWFMFFCF
jgi:hypothetical protein